MFWLVWNREGFPPRYQHETEAGARAEAERLARANPGKSFCVLTSIAEVQAVSVQWKELSKEPKEPF